MALVSIADLSGPPEEVEKRVAQARLLSQIYDQFIPIDEGHYRAPGIHASELYPCLRKTVYSINGVPKRSRVAKFWKQRFKMGTAIHNMLQDDFEKMAEISQGKMRAAAYDEAYAHAHELAASEGLHFTFEREVPCSPKHQALAAHYRIYSSCDGVFTFFENPTEPPVLRVGLEIKSEAPDGYSKLTEPKPEHVRQGHLYMACLDLPLMWFLYMNKGNQNNTKSSGPFLVPFSTSVWTEVEERMKRALEYADAGTLPDRTETAICEFCPWSYTCQPSKMQQTFPDRPIGRKEMVRRPGE